MKFNIELDASEPWTKDEMDEFCLILANFIYTHTQDVLVRISCEL